MITKKNLYEFYIQSKKVKNYYVEKNQRHGLSNKQKCQGSGSLLGAWGVPLPETIRDSTNCLEENLWEIANFMQISKI